MDKVTNIFIVTNAFKNQGSQTRDPRATCGSPEVLKQLSLLSKFKM
jgi:hypothetical protein